MHTLTPDPLMKLGPDKEKKHSLAVIGHLAVDTIIHPNFTIESSPGGSAAAVATAAVQLNTMPSIHSWVGKDYPKEWLRVLEALGMDISDIEFLEKDDSLNVKYDYDKEGQAQIQCSDAVKRSIFPKELPKTDALHICPMQPENQMDLAKKYGGRNILSINFSEYFTHDYKEMDFVGLLDWKAINIVFSNKREGKAITGEEKPEAMARKFNDLGVDIAVLTMGNEGSLIFDGENTHHIDAREVEVVDPTGCGDSYIGAFLGEYLTSRDIQKAGVAGTFLASLTAQKKGSWAALIADVGVRF
jgi:sugar/nucleoside kinase (ribokinase family)